MNVLTNTSCRVVRDIIKRLQSSSTTASPVDIKIPNRIEREPTDILKALERTVSRDPTASHYKYHDDPYLIPHSKQEIRFRALSMESGKKTAMWIYQEHADLFTQELADPIIPEFLPPVTYTTKDQVSEEILLSTILNGRTLDALKIYNLLDENVSTKAKQSLLELLCFTNTTDLPLISLKEERWYKLHIIPKKTCVWNETEEIRKLSNFLMSQDQETVAVACNALICGMAKFYQINQAWSLYLKCNTDKIPLNVNAYNAIIKILPLLKGPMLDPSSEVFKVLKNMSINGIRPNVGTLNAALETVYTFKTYRKAMEFIHILLGEFKVAEVKPSLASYYHILVAAKQSSDSIVSVLNDILNVLEQSTLQLCDPDDFLFFSFAMKIAAGIPHHEIGERVHALFLKDNNYQFINSSFSENIYYRYYVFVNLNTLPIEEFFNFYYRLTTNIYVPEALVFEQIFTALQLHSNEVILEHLPKLWSQMEIYNILDTEKVVKLAINITSRCNVEPDSPLHETFAKFALNIWEHNQAKNSDMRQYLWDSTVLGDIMLLVLRASLYDQVLTILSFMVHKEASIYSVLDVEQINKLLEICILHAYGPIAILLIKYAMMSGLQDSAMMARKVYNSIPLSATEKEELITLVGSDILELQLSDEH